MLLFHRLTQLFHQLLEIQLRFALPGRGPPLPTCGPALLHVLDHLGEIGAALMPAQLAWAFETGRAGLLPQNRALCFAGEDDGRRVALTAEMRA